ncbi:MAG: BMP family ABC transporter substrate-binding protein, partial [Coriobacteriaceae bacterium]|nr:BMP family ABC transporter substrate-binding protein [Coriobacteriaceae bacterium]
NPVITAVVKRVAPYDVDETTATLYEEFLAFYRVAPIYGFFFSKPGSFAQMARLLGHSLDEKWPQHDVHRLKIAFDLFRSTFMRRGGGMLGISEADAFLVYLKGYASSDPLTTVPYEMDARVRTAWYELVVAAQPAPIEYVEQPPDDKQGVIAEIKGIVRSVKPLRVAFIYDRSPETSGWIALHERGRLDLERRLGDEVETTAFSLRADDASFADAVKAAVANESDLIVTCSPRQFEQTRRAAVTNPDYRFINCSINLSSGVVRTFYARMYEAKFVMGALAASMSENHRIGYLAFSPIYGSVSEINAFALGAALVDRQATIYLRWLSTEGSDWERELAEEGVDIIAGRDHPDPTNPDAPFGLYRMLPGGGRERIATPVWDWGRYYELIVRSIRKDTWEKDAEVHRDKALNYWWGMSSGVVRLDTEDVLSAQQRRLVDLLSRDIADGRLIPFAGELVDQRGTGSVPDSPQGLSDERIASMRRLIENVIGRLPKSWELTSGGRDDVEASGVLSQDTDAEG